MKTRVRFLLIIAFVMCGSLVAAHTNQESAPNGLETSNLNYTDTNNETDKFHKEKHSNAYISGVVYSGQDKSVVPFAMVYIEGTGYNVLTDSKGEFKLKVPAGEHKFGVSHVSFTPFSTDVELKKRQIVDMTITLDVAVIALEEVVVTGRTHTRELQERGFSVSSISPITTLRSSFTTDELLNRTAGIKIRQGGGIGSAVEYNINGLSGKSVKVYIDGVPIDAYGRSFSVSNIPPALIERVEVYKGVVPAHLADDALGGAVNVILKNKGAKSLNASYSYGSLNTHNVNLNGLYRDDKSGFYIGGSAYYNSSDNNYKVWGDAVYVTDPITGRVENITAERFHDDYLTYGVNANTGFTGLSWADNLQLNLVYSNIDKDIQTGATMETVYGNRHSKQDSYVANLRYDKENVLPRLDIKTNFAYSYADRMTIDTTNVKYDWSGNPVVDRYGDIVHWATTGEAGRATLAANLENNFNNRTTVQYAIDDEDNHLISANGSFSYFTRDIDDPMLPVYEQNLMDTRKINKYILAGAYDAKFFDKKLGLSLFYKYYNQTLSLTDPIQDDTGNFVPLTVEAPMDGSGYGMALSYKVVPDVMLTLSAENALRLPGITEMIGNTAENVEPNYNLKPEESLNFNIGAMVEPIEMGRSHLGGSINSFYRDVTNMIDRAEINTGDETYNFENIGQILSKGVDFELKYMLGNRFHMNMALSYIDARFNLQYDQNGGEYRWYGDRLRNMPYFLTNGGASYRFPNVFTSGDKLMISYHVNYTHEFYKNWESLGAAGKATIPSQLTHDIGLVYNFKGDRLSLSTDAKNIFNEQLFDNYALQKPGRMVFFKISYKIL